MQQIRRMMRMAPCLVLLAAAPSLEGAEPLHVTLTDVEKNIYVESLHLASDQVTPDCPHAWSVHKHVLHGGRQEGVEVVDVDNGKLRLRVVPTRGIQQIQAGRATQVDDKPLPME